MPSTRSLARAGSAAVPVGVALSLAGLAAAQSPAAQSDLGVRLATQLVGGFLVNVLLAGLLVLFAPSYARKTVGAIRDDPGSAFLWGLLVGIGVPIGLVLIALTVIGLLITIPGLLAVVVLGIVGNAVTVCWVGSLLTGGDVDGAAVGAGAVVFAVITAVPLVGNLATAILGFFGLGVVGRDLYTAWA